MKIERLNENQIRCILSRADFEQRKMGLAELAFGSEKAKDFFQDMMQQAYSELDFEVDNVPLMIEAIPVSMDCLILVITKVDDPEELEARMPDVSNIFHIDEDFDGEELDFEEDSESQEDFMDEEAEEDLLDAPTMEEFIDGQDKANKSFDPAVKSMSDLLNTFKEHLQEARKEYASKQKTEAKKETVEAETPGVQIFQFESLDDVITYSGLAAPFFEGDSALYKDDMDGSFYMILRQLDTPRIDYDRACTIACDYGYAIVDTYGTPSYFTEHFTPVFEEEALFYLNQLND